MGRAGSPARRRSRVIYPAREQRAAFKKLKTRLFAWALPTRRPLVGFPGLPPPLRRIFFRHFPSAGISEASSAGGPKVAVTSIVGGQAVAPSGLRVELTRR